LKGKWGKCGEANPVLKLALAAQRRGWHRTYAVLLELDCWLAGIGAASRQMKRERQARLRRPFAETIIAGPGL